MTENTIVICANGEDRFYDYDMFGVSFDSSEEDILSAVAPMVRESLGINLREGSRWLFKTHKAVSSRNVHIIPNSTAGSGTESVLSYLDDESRLEIFERLRQGAKHLWSKGQLMDGVNEVKDNKGNVIKEDRLTPVWDLFAKLAEEDPLFLAHFTSYVFHKTDDKDLKVLAALASTLSDADGTPFAPGSPYVKPNWRIVGQAALVSLDPKLVLRVVTLANSKRKFGSRPQATHYSGVLRKALRKYLKYREANPKMLEGIARSGLVQTYRDLYRQARLAPSPEAARILRWKQKPGYPGAGVEIQKLSFEGLSEIEVAEKIRAERLSPQVALGELKGKLSPVVAAAVLEQSSGDQAVILTDMFEEQGILKHKEVRELYEVKVRSAKNTLDRVDRIQAELTQQTKSFLEKTRADHRKNTVGDLGKIYIHIDRSGSMQNAIALAKSCGSILAECIKNPETNFHWGLFNEMGVDLPRPKTFEKAAFEAALYNQRAGGGTNCFALYETARKYGCTTDVFITDQGHMGVSPDSYLQAARARHPAPNLVVIVDVRTVRNDNPLKDAFERAGIPVVMLSPKDLTESALVNQAVRVALTGQKAVIEEILNEPLLTLPKWWGAVSA